MAAGIDSLMPISHFHTGPSDIASGHLSFLSRIETVVNIYLVLTKAGHSNH